LTLQRTLWTAYLFLMALLAAGPLLAQERPAQPDLRHFTIVATLNSPASEAETKGLTLVPITMDAAFIIRATIDRVVSGTSPWKVGSTMGFLIHSPTLMFGGAVRNERFVLTFEVGSTPPAEGDCAVCVTKLARDERK
jgi:hypothetical protein